MHYAVEQTQASPRPLRIWMQDESRIGLQLPLPRRLTMPGIKPLQPHQPLYQSYWLYTAVEPATGQAYWWEMSALDSACFNVFLQQFSEQFPNSLNLMVMDNAPAHRAHAIKVPDNVVLLFLPPYCPELNPVERLWQDLKARISATDQRIRSDLQALKEHVAQLIRQYTPEQLRSLTGYDYILAALWGIEPVKT